MASLKEILREKADQLLNLPVEAQRFITNPQAFSELLGINQLPKETGFAAGAVGVPPKDVAAGGVLNPPISSEAFSPKVVNCGISKSMMVSAQGDDGGKFSFSTKSSDMVHFDGRIFKVSYLLLFA